MLVLGDETEEKNSGITGWGSILNLREWPNTSVGYDFKTVLMAREIEMINS